MKEGHELLTGALIGGLIGGIAGLLLAPKSGSQLRNDFSDTCKNMSQGSQELINTLKKAGYKITHPCGTEEEDNNHSSFFVGSATGAVIAGLAALLLAPTSGQKVRQALQDQYETMTEKAGNLACQVNNKGHELADSACDWKDTLVNLIGRLTHDTKKKVQGASKIDEICHMANLGLQLLQQLQRR